MMGLDKRLLSGTTRHWLGIAVLAGFLNIALSVALFTVVGLILNQLAAQAATPVATWYWLGGIVLLKFLFGWLEKEAAFRTSGQTKIAVRDRIYAHALRLGPGILGERRTGELVNLAVDGMEWLETLYGIYWAQFIIGMVTPLLLVAYIFTIDWVVGLVLIVSIPLTPAFLMLVQRRFKSVSDRYFAAEGRLSARFLDSLQGLLTLKAFNRGRARGEELRAENERLRKETMRLLAVNQTALFLVDWGFALGTTVVTVLVAVRRIGAGALTFGSGVTLVLLSVVAARPLNLIGKFFFAGAIGRSVAKQAGEFLDEPPPINKPAGTPVAAVPEPRVRFRDVSFAYTGEGRPALDHFSMDLYPGETVALAGPSGAGKTSVVNLLLRFMAPQAGEILLGDRPLAVYTPEHLRAGIALVSQDPYVFHGTIRENLLIANPDAPEEALAAAARSANLHEFIESLPAGYDSQVGERGASLSGGQVQRLAIARAILKDAPLIILDEPTSQIDSESEALIRDALERLTRGRTVLLISHRLSTVRSADRILMMANGRIIESGDHDSLVDRNGAYATMVRGNGQPATEAAG